RQFTRIKPTEFSSKFIFSYDSLQQTMKKKEDIAGAAGENDDDCDYANRDEYNGYNPVELVLGSRRFFVFIAEFCPVYLLGLLRLVSRQFNSIAGTFLFQKAYYDYSFRSIFNKPCRAFIAPFRNLRRSEPLDIA